MHAAGDPGEAEGRGVIRTGNCPENPNRYRRRPDLLEDVLHPEFRGRGISAFAPDGPEVGPGARRKLYEMFLQAIPDARGEVLDVVAEGDKVVLVDRFGGTHRGEFLGHPGKGDRIEWMAIHIYTIRDGKVLEDAYMRDELAIMQQLGHGANRLQE